MRLLTKYIAKAISINSLYINKIMIYSIEDSFVYLKHYKHFIEFTNADITYNILNYRFYSSQNAIQYKYYTIALANYTFGACINILIKYRIRYIILI